MPSASILSLTMAQGHSQPCYLGHSQSPSAQLPSTTVGVCYVPPITSHQMALKSVTDRFNTRTRHIRAAVAAAAAAAAAPAHIMVAGDFNAKVGNPPDAWVSTFTADIPPRQSQDQGTNALSPHLMQLCEDTFHGFMHRQDPPGHPSYPRGNSRLDHALVSPSLFPFIHSCGISPPSQDSDHHPLDMKLHLPFTPPCTPSTHFIHSFRHTCHQVALGSTKRPAYASSLQSPACDQLLQHSIQASSMHQLTHQLGPQHAAQQASVKRSQHPTTATPHTASAPSLVGPSMPLLALSVTQSREAQPRAHPLPLPF
ncbi:TPA: hypothetical protein ACH3X1_007235 [Trebouxia sp. C0004]